jgi:cytochrome c-type biogenesis protein
MILLLPLVAVVAGALSITSPCCLPLLPAYLSYISSLPVSDVDERHARRATLRASLLFVAGFTTIFTILGLGASALGSLFLRHLPVLVRWSGVVIITLGLANMGVLRVPALQRERRLDLARVPRRPAWAYPMGMAFAAGWTPCIGPILATILGAAAASRTAVWGAFLLVCYSVGLGVPFVLLGQGVGRAQWSFDWLRRNGRHVELVGGALLVAIGVLFVTGQWQRLFIPLQLRFVRLGWPPI